MAWWPVQHIKAFNVGHVGILNKLRPGDIFLAIIRSHFERLLHPVFKHFLEC